MTLQQKEHICKYIRYPQQWITLHNCYWVRLKTLKRAECSSAFCWMKTGPGSTDFCRLFPISFGQKAKFFQLAKSIIFFIAEFKYSLWFRISCTCWTLYILKLVALSLQPWAWRRHKGIKVRHKGRKRFKSPYYNSQWSNQLGCL